MWSKTWKPPTFHAWLLAPLQNAKRPWSSQRNCIQGKQACRFSQLLSRQVNLEPLVFAKFWWALTVCRALGLSRVSFSFFFLLCLSRRHDTVHKCLSKRRGREKGMVYCLMPLNLEVNLTKDRSLEAGVGKKKGTSVHTYYVPGTALCWFYSLHPL